MANDFKEIIVERGAIGKIAVELHHNPRTVSDALKRPRVTLVHREIRDLALNKYNGVYREGN